MNNPDPGPSPNPMLEEILYRFCVNPFTLDRVTAACWFNMRSYRGIIIQPEERRLTRTAYFSRRCLPSMCSPCATAGNAECLSPYPYSWGRLTAVATVEMNQHMPREAKLVAVQSSTRKVVQ